MSPTRMCFLLARLLLLLAIGLSLTLPGAVSSRDGGGKVRIEADVEAVSMAKRTVNLLGVTVSIDQRTAFREDDKEGKDPFTLADIRVGDRLEIRGALDAQGKIVVNRLEREVSEREVILQGPVTSAAPPHLVILGVEVSTQPGTEFEDSSNPNLLASTQFFAAVAPGTLVKAKGVFHNKSIQARKVELVHQ